MLGMGETSGSVPSPPQVRPKKGSVRWVKQDFSERREAGTQLMRQWQACQNFQDANLQMPSPQTDRNIEPQRPQKNEREKHYGFKGASLSTSLSRGEGHIPQDLPNTTSPGVCSPARKTNFSVATIEVK